MGTAKKETPRWRRKKKAPAPQIRLSPAQEKRLVRKMVTATPGGAVTGQVIPPHRRVPASKVMARSGAFRFRLHLVPFEWLAAVLALGLGMHYGHAFRVAVVIGVVAAVVIVLLSRHLSAFARGAAFAFAALTALWLPLLASLGWSKPCPGAAIRLLGVRPGPLGAPLRLATRPEPETPEQTDYETWNLLAAERKWNGTLAPARTCPAAGRRYPIRLDGIKTVIGNVLSASENVAGAWHKPMTEAYAERDPVGVTSEGYLTILGRETLMKGREWNGAGIDPLTGMAVIGRYADGAAAHVKFYTPRYGTRHGLVSGTTGSGKSESAEPAHLHRARRPAAGRAGDS